MKTKLLGKGRGSRYAIVFEIGDEVVAGLLRFARERGLMSGSFYGVGACRRVTLGFFDLETKEYAHTLVDEQVEVMSLIGNIAQFEGEPKVHAHIVIGKRDSTAHGGHLIEAEVRPTLELFLTDWRSEVGRKLDPATDLPLIDLDE